MNLDVFISAVYQTLFHSLWQGALVAVIAGMIIVTTKKSEAALRYNLLLADLVIFIILVSVTFVYHSYGSVPHTRQALLYSNQGELTAATSQTYLYSYIIKGLLFLNAQSALIVSAWCVIIFIKTISLSLGLVRINSIRRDKTVGADAYWNSRVTILSTQLGIRKSVRLLQSAFVRVPFTSGFLKPMVLFPAGLLTSLPPEQLEVILLHELAHIRRNDFAVNILQSLVEILFFFNPALRWLCSLLRVERENCCDDMVIRAGHNKLDYLNALISFEVGSTLNQCAPAFAGSSGSMLNRARRILSNRNKTLHVMEKTILTFTLIIAGLLTLAFKDTGHVQHNGRLQSGKPGSAMTVPYPDNPFYSTRDTVPEKENGSAPGINRYADPKPDHVEKSNSKEETIDERTQEKLTREQMEETDKSTLMAKDMAEAAAKMAKEIQAEKWKIKAEAIKAQADKIRQDLMESKAFNDGQDMDPEKIKRLAEKIQVQTEKMNTKEFRDQLEQAKRDARDFDPKKLEEIARNVQSRAEDMKRQMQSMQDQMETLQFQIQKMKDIEFSMTREGSDEETRNAHEDERSASEKSRREENRREKKIKRDKSKRHHEE